MFKLEESYFKQNNKFDDLWNEIASSLTNVQDNNKDVEIGSYPFFRQGKLGVSIVLRSKDKEKIDLCSSLILEFVKAKNIKVVELE